MSRLFLAVLFIVASMFGAHAQQPQPISSPSTTTTTTGDIPNMGRAPSAPNGIGRLDARVFDASGNPVSNVYLKLESNRTDGFFCESWNSTDARGVAVLPPLHMGRLHLIVKAKGYETQKISVDASTLNEPLHITLVKKK